MFIRKMAAAGALAAACLVLQGCDAQGETATPTVSKEKEPKPAAVAKPAPPAKIDPKRSGSSTLPAGAAPAVGSNIVGSTLKLTGVQMTIPKGWMPEAAAPGPMAPKAVFRLGGVADDPTGCSVRVTYFPGMKGMDRQNIDRWISQVRQPDGTASTREHAQISSIENGNVRVTLVDITGSVNTSMDGQGGGKPDFRLVAAIVDHPKGPHFIKASGKTESMAKWNASIRAFIESAQVP
jgi:hypothetical protein